MRYVRIAVLRRMRHAARWEQKENIARKGAGCPAESRWSVEQRKLIGVAAAQRQAAVRSGIDAADERGVPKHERLERLVPAAGEAILAPDLVEASRIATIAAHEVPTRDPQPTRDPDVDGVVCGERPRRAEAGGGRGGRHGRRTRRLTLQGQTPLIAENQSEVMAAGAYAERLARCP